MKKAIMICLTALVTSALLVGCGSKGSEGEQASNEKRKLVISTWGLNEDILKEDVYKPFEEKFNCEIVLEMGTTPERYTKLSSDPNSKVDIIDLSQAKTV